MNILVVCKNSDKEVSKETKDILKNNFSKVIYAWKNTLKKQELDIIEVIVSIGGDGTALSAAHFNESKPLLAVNSSPKTSVGALTTISSDELNKKLLEISKGDIKTEDLERIQVEINGKLIEHLALNDVFIANEKAYLISKYEINFKDKIEKQFSSGLLFSTGTGSTAWFESAGGTPFSPQSKFIKMVAREIYHHNKYNKPSMQKVEIKEDEEIEIIPSIKSILAIDSIREYHINSGDKIKIKISKFPLKRVI